GAAAAGPAGAGREGHPAGRPRLRAGRRPGPVTGGVTATRQTRAARHPATGAAAPDPRPVRPRAAPGSGLATLPGGAGVRRWLPRRPGPARPGPPPAQPAHRRRLAGPARHRPPAVPGVRELAVPGPAGPAQPRRPDLTTTPTVIKSRSPNLLGWRGANPANSGNFRRSRTGRRINRSVDTANRPIRDRLADAPGTPLRTRWTDERHRGVPPSQAVRRHGRGRRRVLHSGER